ITLSQVLKSKLLTEPFNINHGTAIRMATIFDSTPGTGEHSSLLTTLTTDVKSPLVKTILVVPGSIFYLALLLRRKGMSCTFRLENIFTLLHRHLKMQGLLPLAEGFSPRVYIYSITDKMVAFTSVETHIETLKANPSFDVTRERFDGSEHVQHERHDAERYWNAVQTVWDRSRPVCGKL
ncbi:hypothetical protein K438DRAFT_1583110, partial [Mycena galopus ATCC 62051]